MGLPRGEDSDPSAENLSQQAHRRLIGVLGFCLPILLYIFAGLLPTAGLPSWRVLSSVSAYYYTGGVAVFIGVLFALVLFLLTYRGYKGVIADRVLGFVGGSAALLVALFPTTAPRGLVGPSWWSRWMAVLHYASAVTLFVSFILFAIWLFRKSNVPRRGDRPLEKRRRDDICLASGIVMIVSVLWAASSVVTHAAIFWPESIAIIAFAVSWLTKGEIHKPAIRMMRTLRQRMRGAPAPVVLGVLLTTRLVIPSSAPVEQTEQGRRPPATLVASFDGLGVGLQGPHGRWEGRNPSDNSLAVRPGPPEPPDTARRVRPPRPPEEKGPYSMCYAVSTSADPLGSYYRYEFLRPLFPDYPRPAVWPDGYYVPTSTGDEVIQKHACVADRRHMLLGEPATEQCVVIDGVNFLNNADLDGQGLPPEGAPNVILAAGGAQLHGDFDADGISAWQFSVNWTDPSQTRVSGLQKIAVAPYHYLCDGQLTTCVRQPGTDQHLDAQGDKIMARVVYRNIKGRESVVAVHSVATRAGGGGVRWYEFTVEKDRSLQLRQQGTYAPDSLYRWMASPAIDRNGNIGIGYSFGGSPHFAGQRFAARLAGDRLGQLTLHETVLAEGEAPQTNTMRWEDYTQTAIDPSDDCTIWYVGDYLKKGALTYSTRIGAFRLCE